MTLGRSRLDLDFFNIN